MGPSNQHSSLIADLYFDRELKCAIKLAVLQLVRVWWNLQDSRNPAPSPCCPEDKLLLKHKVVQPAKLWFVDVHARRTTTTRRTEVVANATLTMLE